LCGIWNTAPRTTITNFHWPSLIYLGLAGTAVPTWLQAAAQRVVPAPQAAVIFMLEPVFAAILGFIVLGERLALRGVVGALLIILAAVFSQLTGTGEKCREIAVQQEVGC
jgi:drug/metabolite transporter (DMT)-like permease